MFRIKYKAAALPAPWVAKASAVMDGDTVRVGSWAAGVLVRIFGVDAPEIGQFGFRLSRDRLRAFLQGKKLTVTPRGFDKYGRIVATLRTEAGDDVSEWLLAQGLAWWEYRFARDVVKYSHLQKEARMAGLGIWARKPWGFAPWIWRYRHRVGF